MINLSKAMYSNALKLTKHSKAVLRSKKNDMLEVETKTPYIEKLSLLQIDLDFW